MEKSEWHRTSQRRAEEVILGQQEGKTPGQQLSSWPEKRPVQAGRGDGDMPEGGF